MKKVIGIFMTVVLFLSCCINVNAVGKNSDSSIIPADYRMDVESNLYGPEDYVINGDCLYILDTCNNVVSKSDDFGYRTIIELSRYDIVGTKIAVSDDTIWVLDNQMTLNAFNTKNDLIGKIKLTDYIHDEAICDLYSFDARLYISTPEGEFDYTYVFEELGKDNIKLIDKFDGRVGGDGRKYIVKRNNGLLFSYSYTVYVYEDGGEIKSEYYISSNNLIGGIVYLGSEDNLNSAYLEIIEYETINELVNVSRSIVKINSMGGIESTYSLPVSYKEIVKPTRWYQNKIYHFNTQKDKVMVCGLDDLIVTEKKQFVSQRNENNIVDNREDQVMITRAGITRAQIMANAVSYHTSFTWTCTSANLAYLANWTKPHYVTNAGTYQMMPYCWGGFNSISEFTTGLANGGRVGNINTVVVSNTFGLDCSGYVSRCWNTSQKYGTWTISSVSYSINLSDIKQGDALNNPGSHIMLFDSYDSSGDFILYECTQLNNYDRVAHTIRSSGSVTSSYTPIRYNNVTD